MNLNLRHAIIQNVSGNTKQELQDTIVDAIQSQEEKMLPGLGVLFEVIWQNANDSEKEEMLSTLSSGLQRQ
ncbi:small, acid-soluble spore protein I [Schinkia azotoformans MEV2011]|uniref:Small, acid-soluble spore protein I n=1 Tax=Schinkia azotoformans MEV2011 TaxID=1348973 RepID=A0A072NQN5_SCHAZ|nr:small acid-soluble spore protein SspI [Schinkia azotoformans]KEF39542.1 small, acid-soluble spore protein I [Schinkia azotoformans MEV2011]MEC1694232.1 small acid-soluble spore protein SspI [Schinkia azotoformans]MEC1714967.1 small acid-soluble spore protein SspI [Schinkia azotoformans]MEC1723554.1 small acid-soluble spore protein SspI [Schinkia azotoformans]MEC1740201.1 small acid-soluble spore protein SspI [Schinkia azotoformans]